jgi:hypothetical protein
MPDQQKTNNKLNLSLDFRVISVLLLIVVVAMLLLWRPWQGIGTSDRTISVTGESTVSAEPDEYVFYPSYKFANNNVESLSRKNDEVVKGLKALGVEDKDIKNNSSDYDFPVYREGTTESKTLILSFTITVNEKALAGGVQDYLLTTDPTGAITPQYTFSDDKRRELESQARDEATKDARAKAEQSANNLGFKIGEVKEVTDGSGFGVFPARGEAMIAEDTSSFSLQPGENKLSYSVTVVYFVK